MKKPTERLRHHVTGAIERGEAKAIVEQTGKTPGITEALEAMIDKHGLLHVVTGLELICREKAEHIRVNWQDHAMARTWDIAARQIDNAARRLPVFPWERG